PHRTTENRLPRMTVLIVGLGSIARKHIQALRLIRPDTRFYALRSSPAAAPVEGVTDCHDLSILPKVDFVIIANPTSRHYDTIERLLYMRVPLFIEKPLFHELQGGADLVARCEGMKTYVACNLRFHPCVGFVRNFLAAGRHRINEVNIYCGSY